MHKRTLRELSKFASGLIAADFIVGLWFYFGNYLPMKFFGIMFNEPSVIAWLIFDALLFIFLVHFGWHMKEHPHTKNEKIFHIFAGILFTIVALLHLARIIFGWNFLIGMWHAPYWINGLATVITAFLAYVSFHLASEEQH